MLVTNQVAQKLVEDCRHGVGEDLPVLHAFLEGREGGERERERDIEGERESDQTKSHI